MAKPQKITDFTSLKGKLTFSDDSPVTKQAAEKADVKAPEVSKKEDKDRGLKVGQKVVLMDSDLRGRIVSLGRSVGIELEDGLTIQAAYGEFAVYDEREISALKQSKIKVGKTSQQPKKIAAPQGSGMLSVDLHIEAIPGGSGIPKGQQLQFQMDTFRRVIRENMAHRDRKICFIHGIGDGILKAAIRKELDEVLALRCSYSVGDPAVTTVTIR